ncbi:hypothetical protein HPY42_01750 [Coprothermobacteraceae bacterium]|nr:hypothetical protein [Coprothermobacteraceae bacterium]
MALEPEEVARVNGIRNIGAQGSSVQTFLAGREVQQTVEIPVDVQNRRTQSGERESLEVVVSKVKKIMEALNPNIDVRFEHHPAIRDVILGSRIVFYDKKEKKPIKEIPPEKVLELYAELLKKLDAIFFDKEV